MTAVLERPSVNVFSTAQNIEHVGEPLPPVGRTLATAQRRYLTSASPWRGRDVLRSALLGAVGATGVTAFWYQSSNEAAWRDQIGAILGGLLAVGVLVLGAVLWLITGFREVRRGLRDLEVDKQNVFSLLASRAEGLAAPLDWLVVATGMTRAHRPECLLVRGKSVKPAPSDLEPCGVCQS